MRVAFYTNATATDSLCVLERLGACQQHEVVRVYLYDTLAEAKQSPLKILRELGWQRVLQKLVQVGSERAWRVVRKVRRLPPGPVRTVGQWAERQGMPCHLVTDLNHPSWVDELLNEQIDVLLVCICKNILRRSVLEAPRVGVINIHPSLLPRYRGPMPVFWMLYQGDVQAGVTFQRMTERIDTGPIVAQFPVTLDAMKSEAQVSRELFQLAAEHVEAVLAQVAEGKLAPRQATGLSTDTVGSYYSYPTKGDIRELERRQRARRLG